MQPLAPTDPRTAGEFRLSARLGLGGMGQVFLGYSPAGRAVAVKICHPELAADPAFVERFAREATAAQAVNGLYTAQVVGAGPYDKPPWMATAYVPGPSLTDYVYGYGPLPEPAAWRLAAGLAEALLAVHACGLVHRDLKPSNVLLAVDGPRVIDFGIASALEGPGLTNTGSVMGSPPYMSPEQAMGVPTGPPSDVFALGSTLAFAASGAPPFGDGDAAALLFRVVHLEPAIAAVPERLRGVVAACLAKDPAARPTLPQLLRACQDGAAAGGNSAASFWPPQMTAVIAGHQAAGSMSATPPNGTVPSGGTFPSGRPGLSGGHGPSSGQVLSGWQGDPHPATIAAAPGPSTGRTPLGRAATTVATAISRRRVLSGVGGLIVAGGLAAAGFELAGSRSTDTAVTDKRVAWVHKADGPVRTGAAISADGGTVYIGSDRGTVYMLDAASGRLVGTHRVGGAVTGLTMGGVGAAGDTLLVGSTDGKVYAFTTGGQGATWTSQAAGAAIVGAPTSGGKAVYVGSRDGNFYAINLISGQREWQAKTGVAMPSPPWNHTVWAGSQDGTMYVFHTDDGKLLDKVAVHAPVSAAPLDVIGQAYVATSKGVVYDLFYEDLLNGTSTTVNWTFQGDGAIMGTPVPAGNGDTFFAATVRGTVYAIQPGSDIGNEPGTALWHLRPGGPVRSGLAFHDNVLYVGSDDGYLYAIDTTGPALSWKHKTGGAIRSQILVTGGLVYFGSLDNHVYALRA
jgi:serine/threonine protein kinase/outer membrane protein assembly factor BamB